MGLWELCVLGSVVGVVNISGFSFGAICNNVVLLDLRMIYAIFIW